MKMTQLRSSQYAQRMNRRFVHLGTRSLFA